MIKLRNGIDMPLIGLGTFKVTGRELVFKTVEAALSAGYRSIDTAAEYYNEEDIGNSLAELLPRFNLKREDVFITSKLGPKDQGEGSCRDACLKSLTALGLEYLDLYLIHWPGRQFMKPEDPGNPASRMASWRDMETLHKEGKLRAIGVSNYEKRHLEELLSQCNIPPAVLQTEFHPHLNQQELIQFCKDHDIHFQAYSSLGTTADENKLLHNATVMEIAKSYNVSPAQVLLRWAVQQNTGVIPKSTNPEHIRTNMDIFNLTLSENDMERLNNLDQQHHYCLNPSAVN